MAVAWFNRVADPTTAHAISAGTQPSDHVHPVVVEATKEKGIDP
jgi:protein-tyrosine-phosphatase